MTPSVALEEAAPSRLARPLPRAAIDWCSAVVGALLVLVLHGYHPYSSDGSIYVAGIRRMLTPSLYTADAEFVVAHMRLSIFSTVVAHTVTLLHLPLDLVLLAGYLLLTTLTLLLAGRLARRLLGGERAGWGAMLLLVACYPMPVAATSLMLADPYMSARSVTLPLTLCALLLAADHSWWRAGACAVLVGLLHPIMGAHLLLFLTVLFLVGGRAWRTVALLCATVFAGAALLHFSAAGASASPAYLEAVASRTYYFLARWEWYEGLGLVAPLVLLAAAAQRLGIRRAAGRFALASVLVGATCALVSLCFVHPSQPDLLMRVQPLRAFHTVYLVGAVLLGGTLAAHARGWMLPALGAALAGVAVGMYLNGRSIYAPVSHIELPALLGGPGAGPVDSWQKALLWVEAETPASAVFAVDPRFLEAQGESMPGFRAVSGRSILTDVKDEGLATLFPGIAPDWAARRDRELGLDTISDAERITRLRAAGVTWVLLSPAAPTQFFCPFRNPVVKVCKLPGAFGG